MKNQSNNQFLALANNPTVHETLSLRFSFKEIKKPQIKDNVLSASVTNAIELLQRYSPMKVLLIEQIEANPPPNFS